MKSASPPSALHSCSRIATRLLPCSLLLCALPAIAQALSGYSQQDLENRIQAMQPQGSVPPDPSQIVVEHVHGIVIDAIDKKPVARVLVSSGDQRMATMTDYDGKFSFDVQRVIPAASSGSSGLGSGLAGARGRSPTTTVYLMVRRPGYLQKQTPVRLSSDPEVATGVIELKIVPEGVIRGHLSMPNAAEARIQVQLRRRQVQDGSAMWMQAGGVQANGHGEFRFAELQAGDYKVMTLAWTERRPGSLPASDESSGYAPAYYGDSADLASSPVIHVGAGDTFEANLSPRAATFYRVTIPAPSLAKSVGANVTVGDQDQSAGLSLSLNQQTHTIEGFLPNGAYDFRVYAFGQPQSSGKGRVEVAGKPVKGAPIAMLPNGQIPVIVSQEYTASHTDDTSQVRVSSGPSQRQMSSRRPIDLSLRSLSSQGPGATLKYNPDQGDEGLVLENAGEGTYRVVATATGGYIASMTANGVDLLREPLTVGPGGASGPIQVTVRDDAATLTGTIATSDAAGASQNQEAIAILCLPLDGIFTTPVAQTGSNYQGKFTLSNLAPGDYLVLAFNVDGNAQMTNIEYRNPDVLSAYMSKGTVVTLTAGQKATIQVPLLIDGEN
jgi:hypothetical protein